MIELTIIIIIILGMIFKKSKLLTYTMMLAAVILIGGSSLNADYYSYENNYFAIGNGLNSWNFEIGFQWLNRLIFNLGFSYQQFRLIIALMGMLLIYKTIKKFTNNTAYVMALYLIYPLILDTIQIRNFLAMSIVIYGMRYIICLNKQYLKYILTILLATSIHSTMAFYLAVLLVSLKNNRRMTFLVTSVSILSAILMPYLIKGMSFFVASEKINAYFFTETSMFTQAGVFLYFLYSIFIVKFMEWKLSKREKGSLINENKFSEGIVNRKLSKDSFKTYEIDKKAITSINIIALLSLPLVVNNLNFFRLYRNLFIINYIYYGFYLEKYKKSYNGYLVQLLIIMLIVGSFILLIYLVPQTDIIAPVFEYNIFF